MNDADVIPIKVRDRKARMEEELAAILARKPRQPSPATITAADLKRHTFPAIRYIIPGYVTEGCTLLAGAPKLGKSWMVVEFALAKATGESCLGTVKTPVPGDVLYLALEDNFRRLQSRLDKLMPFATEWPERLTFATEWPRAHEGGLDRIREWASSRPDPCLVIIDVLAMFRPPVRGKEGAYDHDYHSVKQLQALASELRIAIVIVHHTRKSRDQVDPFDRVSGTLGLSGAADAVLILDRDGQGVTLYGRGRDIPEIETVVTFNRDACRWSVTGPAAEVKVTDERRAVTSILIQAPEPMTPAEIAGAARKPTTAIKQLIFRMNVDGQVVKVSRGRYVHPDRVDLMPNLPPVTTVTE